MSPTTPSSEPWYGALSWSERGAAAQPAGAGAAHDAELAGLRLADWRAQLGGDRETEADGILSARGWTVDTFRHLLGENVGHLARRHPALLPWRETLRRAYSDPRPGFEPSTAFLPGDVRAGFLHLVEPLVAQTRRHLRNALRELQEQCPAAPFDPGIERALFAPMPAILMQLLSRTLTLELHVARLGGQLDGDSAEARFESFTRRLGRPEVALALLEEYPVLARQLVEWLQGWADFARKLLEHLIRDWEQIRETFFPGREPGALVDVEGNLGDRHRGGRTVLALRLEDGSRLIYKPKPLAVDTRFQELLDWLNQRGEHPPLRLLQVLDRGSYGWVEYLSQESCRSEAGVRRFYRRQGAFLALFYALGATDFHYENLIAVGEDPVPVDLESLFSSRRSDATDQQWGPAFEALGDSVLRIGLLPQQSWTRDRGDGVDLSGLGFEDGQLSPHKVPGWLRPGTDEMRFTRQRIRLPAGRHRPSLEQNPVRPASYRREIEEGFVSLYRTLMQHREALVAPGGPLAAFAEDEIRVILRPTRTYGLLLGESFHPDVLRDAIDRDILFDRLWLGIRDHEPMREVLEAEQADLRRGDIPMFTTRPGKRDIWTSDGRRIADFLDEPGLELAHQRLAGLGEADLARQLWIVGASLSLTELEGGVIASGRYPLPRAEPASPEALLAAAERVGDRLGELALSGASGDGVSWVGLGPAGSTSWAITPLGLDIYSGVPGLALFLAHLGEVSGGRSHTRLAERALETLKPHLSAAPELLPGIGGFAGLGGVIWCLAQLAVLWRDEELLAEALALAGRVPARVAEDEQLDLIGGAAGCLLSLLALYEAAPEAGVLAAARRCGEHLLDRARPMRQGIGWKPAEGIGQAPLSGLSHGASGMALALARLSRTTGDGRYLEAAAEALAYERTLFVPEAGNWLDLRDRPPEEESESDEPRLTVAWCHGAPGIGLARLELSELLPEAGLLEDVDTAVATTVRLGLDGNHSLCHGTLGNLELLSEAGRRLGRTELESRGAELAGGLLAGIVRDGWLCGIPGQVETPGLMTGLAGIGYGLLRLAAPDRVPSVLTLEAPRETMHPDAGHRQPERSSAQRPAP